MNRQLKFRVWDKKIQSFWHNLEGATKNGIILTSEGNPGIVSDLTTVYEPKSVNIFDKEFLEIQQFTGILDVKGREIFEGDIIKQPHRNAFGPVKWVSEAESWDFSGWLMDKSTYGDGLSGSEIIGNIFENPELIKI